LIEKCTVRVIENTHPEECQCHQCVITFNKPIKFDRDLTQEDKDKCIEFLMKINGLIKADSPYSDKQSQPPVD